MNTSSARTRIWYVEDDVDLADITRNLLDSAGYQVSIIPDGRSLLGALEQTPPDLLMLDWNLPDTDGMALCQRARRIVDDLPILMVTVRDDPHDIVRGLDNGADDYVTKPFDANVLMSRIRALLRRSAPAHAIIGCGDVTIDVDSARAFLGDEALELTSTEYRLLLLLMENKGRVMTRGQIIQRIWEDRMDAVCDNTLTVTMRRLRSKLGASNTIRTVRSFGYRMEEPS